MKHFSIPVEVARQLGDTYHKDRVLLLAYQESSGRTDVVTWGRTVEDKREAAAGGDRFKELIGGKAGTEDVGEDYRREGEAAKRVDDLVRGLRKIEAAMTQTTVTIDDVGTDADTGELVCVVSVDKWTELESAVSEMRAVVNGPGKDAA